MSPSHQVGAPTPHRCFARLLGVMLVLLGSVMATVALAVPESSATAAAPGSASPTPQASLNVQAAAVTWSNSNVTTVSAGREHSCAIENGNLFCWGAALQGRLGDGTTGDANMVRLQPVAVVAGAHGFTQGQVTAVSAGHTYTCAISAGTAYCWGEGYYLGRGVDTDASVPVPVALNGASVRAIAASSTHACAVTTAGAAWCWGRNADGQLGNGSKTTGTFFWDFIVLNPVEVTGLTSGVVDIGVGDSHSCALMSNGGVKCWGNGANGRLGRGSTVERLTPDDVAIAGVPITNATQLSVGRNHSCIVTTETEVRCWGVGNAGQLGRGDTDDGWVPNPPVVTSGGPHLADQVAVSAGQQHTCSVSSTGVVNCWGWNNLGQLGNGLKEASAFKVPQAVPGTASYTNTLVTGVSAAPEHTCVVRSGKSVCWGHQKDGRLGDGDNSSNTVAGAFSVFTPPAAISPATQTVNGVQGVVITPTTAFSASNFAGAVTYADTAGTLPADLTMDADTGVVSGTPSAVGTTSVTITATDGTSTATATITFDIVAPPPAVDLSAYNGVGNTSRNGTVGTPLSPPLVIRTISMAGPVTFAAMTQPSQGVFEPTTIPPGLSIEVRNDQISAEIVGTPTQDGQFPPFYIAAYDNGGPAVYSSSSIIITVAAAASTPTGGDTSAGPVVVLPPGTTEAVAVEPPPTSAPTETSPSTTVPVANGVGDSALITPERQEQLTSSAGDAKVLVGGELVEVSVTQASADLRASDPAQRTAAQVAELQNLASSMMEQLSAALGGAATAVSVRNTPTGAVVLGLATDPVTGQPMEIPVENVVFVAGGGLILMASGVDGREPARIGLDGAVEIPEGGYVSIVAGGLTPGDNGEVVVMSTPRLIGSFAVAGSGDVRQQAVLPTGLGAGTHTLVVTVGDDAASLGFRIVGRTIDMTLPVTGVDRGPLIGWSLAVLVLGLALLAPRCRRYRLDG